MSELNYTKVPSRMNSGKFQFCSQKTKLLQNKKNALPELSLFADMF